MKRAATGAGWRWRSEESSESDTRDRAREENSEIQQDKVLEQGHAKWLELGATGQAIRSDSTVATVGTLDRAENFEG